MAPPSKTTLVVGATGRLGVALAKALAARGDKVVLTARDARELEALAPQLAPLHGSSPPTVCADLTRPDAVDTIVAGVRQKASRIENILLACGPFPRTP